MKGETRKHSIAANFLGQVTLRKNLSLVGGQRKKAIEGSLRMMHRDRLRNAETGLE